MFPACCHLTLESPYFALDNQRAKMPINFTVVPVEDAEGDSNSAAEAGGNKPVSLGKLFGEKKDEDNLEESNKGRDTVKDQTPSLACRHAHTLR